MMRHIRHNKIDRVQWDALIELAPNGLIYALTWYLDIVSPGWEALVKEDQGRYVAVMPLPVRKKFGFRYLQQPLFAQQLGVFSLETPTTEDWKEIGQLLRREFRLITNYAFNISNSPSIITDSLLLPGVSRSTYHLSLRPTYSQLFADYKPSRRRQLQQARNHNLTIESTTDIEQLIRLFDEHTAPKIYGLIGEGHAYPLLRSLYREAQRRAKASIWQVKTTDGKVVASMLLLKHNNEVTYLFNSSSIEGKATRAISLLIDEFLSSHAETNLLFDFEAPEIPNLVQFYSSFGSAAVPYLTISYNRLPWLLQQAKAVRMALMRRLHSRNT